MLKQHSMLFLHRRTSRIPVSYLKPIGHRDAHLAVCKIIWRCDGSFCFWTHNILQRSIGVGMPNFQNNLFVVVK